MDPSYNNSFGSANSGDIVLAGSPSTKKRSKKIWVGIIAGFTLLVLGLVLFILLAGRSKNDYASRFNIFANLVISGEEKNESINFDSYEEFYLVNNYKNSEYTKKLNNRYKEFMQSVSSKEQDFDNLPLYEMQERLEFLEQVSILELIDSDSIKDVYLNAGKEEALKLINTFYDKSIEQSQDSEESQNGNQFILLVKEYDMEDNKKMIAGYENGDYSIKKRNVADRLSKDSALLVIDYVEQINNGIKEKNG